jgi:hypothetical protein
MGYQTDFSGEFKVTPPLNPQQVAYLRAFNRTRRMQRYENVVATIPDPKREAVALPIGPDGAYCVGIEQDYGQVRDASVLDYNEPPAGQPGLWCQWTASDDGQRIIWDEGEKFYDYTEWLCYLVEHFLKPWGCVINGEVSWQGEAPDDIGVIYAKDNLVEAVQSNIVNDGPSWGRS